MDIEINRWNLALFHPKVSLSGFCIIISFVDLFCHAKTGLYFRELDISATDLSSSVIQDILIRIPGLTWLAAGQLDGMNDEVGYNSSLSFNVSYHLLTLLFINLIFYNYFFTPSSWYNVFTYSFLIYSFISHTFFIFSWYLFIYSLAYWLTFCFSINSSCLPYQLFTFLPI